MLFKHLSQESDFSELLKSHWIRVSCYKYQKYKEEISRCYAAVNNYVECLYTGAY
jgi:hypothetical protein